MDRKKTSTMIFPWDDRYVFQGYATNFTYRINPISGEVAITWLSHWPYKPGQATPAGVKLPVRRSLVYF
jgi:hypothetical protein